MPRRAIECWLPLPDLGRNRFHQAHHSQLGNAVGETVRPLFHRSHLARLASFLSFLPILFGNGTPPSDSRTAHASVHHGSDYGNRSALTGGLMKPNPCRQPLSRRRAEPRCG